MPLLPEIELDLNAELGEVHLPTVSILVGSLQVQSLNLRFAEEARDVLSEQADVQIVIPDLPLFSQDYEHPNEEPSSPRGREFRQLMRSADAVLVVSPEYDRLPSAITLNACHWLSRPPARPLENTPVMLAGVSAGRGATRPSRPMLRLALERIGADVLDEEFFIAQGDEVFSSSPRELRAELRAKLPLLLNR